MVHSHGILSDIAVVRSGYSQKSISTIHCNVFEDYRLSFGIIKGFIFALVHIFYLNKIKFPVACSGSVGSALKKFIPNITFVRNGLSDISESENDLRNQLGIKDDSVVFVYAGKLNRRKNVLKLVKDFANEVPNNCDLVIVGSGKLENEVKKYSSKNIHIVGFKTNVHDYYEMADVYVSYSRSEGFSISIIEALQHNLSLLLSEIPSHEEFFSIDNNLNIGLIASGSLGSDIEKLSLGGNDSRKLYEKYLTGKVMADAYMDKYKEIARL